MQFIVSQEEGHTEYWRRFDPQEGVELKGKADPQRRSRAEAEEMTQKSVKFFHYEAHVGLGRDTCMNKHP